MKQATLVFLIDKNEEKICLGMKKRGFGASRWNGFGGKVIKGESILQAGVREILEETSSPGKSNGVIIGQKDLQRVAILNFVFPHRPEWNQEVYVFLVEKWKGLILESEEMKPCWFEIENIPYDSMWADDRYWLPQVIEGDKLRAEFIFNEKDELIGSKLIKINDK